MAESDRPTPDAQPGETSPDTTEGLNPGEEMFLADGTPVSEASPAASAEEMDELLALFEEDMAAPALDDEGPNPLRGLSEQEAEEEALLMQAEALLGTTDPAELEQLAEVHQGEASEHYRRILEHREQLEVPPPPAAAAEPVAAEEPLAELPAEAEPTEAEAAPIEAAADEEPAAVDEPLAELLAEAEAAEAEDVPVEAVADVEPAAVDEPLAEVLAEAEAAEAEAAPIEAAADVEPVAVEEPLAELLAEAEPAEAEAVAGPDEDTPMGEGASDWEEEEEEELIGAVSEASEERVPALAAFQRLRPLFDLPLRVLRAVVRRLPFQALLQRLGPVVADGARRFAASKGRLAAAAGLTAACAAMVGFSLFEARFTARVLQRRFPDAVSQIDLQYLQAVADIEEGQFARARQRLRRLDRSPDAPRAADILFALAEAHFLDTEAPPSYRYTLAREFFLSAIAADPTHPQNTAARRRIADTYRAQALWPEAAREYTVLLERSRRPEDRAATYLALGDVLLADGRHREAADAFEHAWNEYPESAAAARARLRHGDALHAAGRTTDAQQLWAGLSDTRTPAAVRWAAVTRLARLAEAEGDVRASLAWWEAWLRGATDTAGQADALVKFAQLQQQAGDPTASVESLRFVLETYPDSPVATDAALMWAAYLRSTGESTEAREVCADALQHAPDEPRLLMALRDSYASDGVTDRALEYARRAAAADPNSAAAQLHLAAAYRAADQPQLAMKVYWEMLPRYPLAPETRTAVKTLVGMLQERDFTAEAYEVVNLYATMATDGQTTAAMHEAKAALLVGLGLWEKAEAEFRAAVEASATPGLYVRLAEAQVHVGDWTDALASVDAVDATALDAAAYTQWLTLKSHALIQSGRADEAAVALTRGESRLGELPLRLQGLRAEAYMALGDTAAARELMARFDAALEADVAVPPALSSTYLAWAQHLYERRIYSRAAAYYARVQGDAFTAHDLAWAAYQIGNCYSELQDFPRAAEAYEQMIATHPRAPWVPFAREKAQFAVLQVDTARRENRT